MTDEDTTKQVADIQERLGKKKNKSAGMFSDFSSRAELPAVDKDTTLRELLTSLRMKWREQPGDAASFDSDQMEDETT